MKKKLIAIAIAAISATAVAGAQNSFAIIVDSESYKNCKNEIEDYRESVANGGLNAFVVEKNWANPEEVKDTLLYYYKNNKLEGAVFVGDIPIAMIRQAQHFTSAFKMNEAAFTIRETSVPSDRFYDDFDLKFNFINRDEEQTDLFYYNLDCESPQMITCDIYTGRIRPSSERCDKYEELSKYLRKVVKAKKEGNTLDKITSYTGDGSFSNSLIAWKDETITIGEQMPQVFATADGAKFFAWSMYPYMKDIMIDEIKRDDLDMVFFHEHGMPERQYLTGQPIAEDMDSFYEQGKLYARQTFRRLVKRGSSHEEAVAYMVKNYGVDTSWFIDAFTPEMVKADSIADVKTGIVLDDIAAANPNVTMALFDACYNGAFHETDCVANRYIMSDGKTVVCFGNSVNVLQDKSSSDLMGMLSCGYSAGQWQQQVHILESHVIGDPTFAFTSTCKFEKPDLLNKDVKYWKKYLDSKYPCDIQGLALHKLFNLEYEGMSDLLLETYRKSDYYMVRLQCMHLLAHYYDDNYSKLLAEALDDPYEFIRRKAAYFTGKVGKPETAKDLVNMYLNEYNALRVSFNIECNSGYFAENTFIDEFRKALEKADFIFDKEAFGAEAEKKFDGSIRVRNMTEKLIKDKTQKTANRMSYINGMRNCPYPLLAEGLVTIVTDSEEEEVLRVKCAEVLGWYVRAHNRGMIVEKLQAYLDSNVEMPEAVRNEIVKTNGRLKAYMR